MVASLSDEKIAVVGQLWVPTDNFGIKIKNFFQQSPKLLFFYRCHLFKFLLYEIRCLKNLSRDKFVDSYTIG